MDNDENQPSEARQGRPAARSDATEGRVSEEIAPAEAGAESKDTPPPKSTLPQFTPVPRKCNRHDGWTPARQRGFIEALADTGSVRAAAQLQGMTPESAYQLRRQEGAEEFAAAWEAALAHGVKRIEDVAMDRALNGVEVPVYSYGKLVGTRVQYNDRLLMFMLRNRASDRFTDGRARALNALDQATLKRLKEEWRQEWERARFAEDLEEEQTAVDKFYDLLESQRNRKLDQLSPRARAAFDEFERIEAEDKANGYSWVRDPDHPLNAGEDFAGESEDEDPIPLPPPGWHVGRKPEEEEEWDGVHRLKDDGWD